MYAFNFGIEKPEWKHQEFKKKTAQNIVSRLFIFYKVLNLMH